MGRLEKELEMKKLYRQGYACLSRAHEIWMEIRSDRLKEVTAENIKQHKSAALVPK